MVTSPNEHQRVAGSIRAGDTETALNLYREGKSVRQVASALGLTRYQAHKVTKQLGSELNPSKGGRPISMSATAKRLAVRLATTGAAKTAVDIARQLPDDVSDQTVRRTLRDEGLKARKKVKKPKLTSKHKKARLDWAVTHQHWTERDWMSVIWSDETKINRVGSDGPDWVWMRPNEVRSERSVQQTTKFGGGSIMVWGCMGWFGVGYSEIIDGIMDAEKFVQILESSLLRTIEELDVDSEFLRFQQDNDPKHTSRRAKAWFQEQQIALLPWPAQSPDLNPIEHLWSEVKRGLNAYEEDPRSIAELEQRTGEVWTATPKEKVRDLIRSMPRRCEAVIKAKGAWTKY